MYCFFAVQPHAGPGNCVIGPVRFLAGNRFFTAPCFSNGAVMPSLGVRPSVTLVIPDHIR